MTLHGCETDHQEHNRPVIVHHPDGTTEERPAYTQAELAHIDRQAAKHPRTWDEINSTKGGGRDYGPRR